MRDYYKISKLFGLSRRVKDIELNTFPVYGNRYIKTKIRAYGDKVYTNFKCAGRCTECESFTVISIYSLLVHENNCYLQVYIANCAHKIVDMQMTGYLDDNPFETDEN